MDAARRQRPPLRGRGFGAAVPDDFSGWRAGWEGLQELPPTRRARRRPPARPSWAQVESAEMEEVANQAAERRRLREQQRRHFLGRHRISAPRTPELLQGFPRVGRPAQVGVSLALVLVLALAAAWLLPWLKVQRVEVEGQALVGRAQLLRLAGARMGESTLFLNSGALTRNVQSQLWVATAQVSVHWPGTLVLRVRARPPVMVYEQGSAEALLANTGASLGPPPALGGGSGMPLLLDQRRLPPVAPGSSALDPRLTRALVLLAGVFPKAYGVSVARYVITRAGALEIQSTAGWTADLGLALTQSQIASLGPKLEALRALGQRLDLKSPSIRVIYLEDPNQVVVDS
ncbi:MAG: cell division protein FtsQ/DivIB [Candidatus Dormibacteria bacterium]